MLAHLLLSKNADCFSHMLAEVLFGRMVRNIPIFLSWRFCRTSACVVEHHCFLDRSRHRPEACLIQLCALLEIGRWF